MRGLVVLALVWAVALLAQWLAFSWWRRSVAAGLLAVYVAAALASPADALRPVADAAGHLFQARGQSALMRALTILDGVAVAAAILGVVFAVKGAVAEAAGDAYYRIDPDSARPQIVHGGRVPGTRLAVSWTREVLDRDDEDRSAVAALIRVVVAALGAVVVYYALAAGLVAVYLRRGLARAAALPDANHFQIAFWLLIGGSIVTALWKARRWQEAVHVILVGVGDHEWALSSWRHGLGRVAVDLYAHPDAAVASVGGAILTAGTAPADVKARRGWTCRGLLIAPSPAGWPPDRPGSPTHAADCAAWFARLHACVDAGHFDALPALTGMRGRAPEPTPVERVMRRALEHDALPVEYDRGVPKDGTTPASQDRGDYYWPDAALRVQGDLLLICVELDGKEHLLPGREERDEQRDIFFGAHGWYVLRIFTKGWDPVHWQRDLVRDVRRLVTTHELACRAARGTRRDRA